MNWEQFNIYLFWYHKILKFREVRIIILTFVWITAQLHRPECMRFLVRLTLLGVLFLIFLLLILIQQKSIIIKNKLLSSNKATFLKENIFNNKSKINNNNNNFLIFIRPKVNLNEPTEEDKEARRLLQLSGSTSDDGIPVPVGQQPNNINNGGNYPQLETVVGSGLLFPIGRYPSGNIRGNVIKGQLTLNVAVVLVVSLLSIAV
ncbi:hypothetical protein Mgra_00001454 [Meloidogyne graminicola]|uniref:Uncharacterized protein n=1 Tax=Meloidogyne graminicola TaxID=189291 RepID=A0A8T0A069_9BILA|nr:hypothetical protein Mgra_00001454 [Meloidogyne graminicola]